ncbi:pitrilysin family protein [Saccharibacillus sp. CPCC 101409]|uniref:M16 family metallopeptidase n=1 Tax=Saccharibacillus sp. CPCC 101409 TaxID=3058041 RepID=UPI0026719735|nr:pitrilysin family protein [Saccharibacillus sp. CPCC 101409]MDO3410649.1 pitrilysin family protein [Saccharibacillus sp. CPCC 101409]
MEKYTLGNGLRVVAEHIPGSRSVSFGIWVKNGSRNETQANNGVSHFIEHMLFKGTERYDARAIAEQFDAIGGNVNAFTSKEYTSYYAKVLDEHLPIAMDILSDMFFNSAFDPEELAREKNVIFEEISMYLDDPDDLVHDLIVEAAYEGHPLAMPILGTEDHLAAMTSDDLKSFLRENYTADNTIVAIAGNLVGDVRALIEQHFGAFDRRGEESPIVAPNFGGGLVYRKKKTEQNHICLAFQGFAYDDPRQYAMALLNNAIGGGMSSKLFQEIREKRGLAYSVYSYHSAHADSGYFTIYAGTAPKQTAEVLKLTQEVLRETAANGLSEAEIHKGKQQLKGSLIMGLEGSGSRMNRLGKNELMLGRHETIDETIAKIERVTEADVRLALDHLFAEPFAVAMVGNSDRAISALRRDELVPSGAN